ncbi:hypothetical protein PGTUg99_036661 [Puccinia graminis f. sp. tritici]|uniref:Uncharacterized protein n=1 Tax=Puccinia graminis f. sp. tritici TaxID=56615 RepID=A0A5B0R9B6_PUCGR|nr:hypothetical protein PGTUg99_036661 [Puccinia graminis f. sp. tritici]
MRQVLSRLIGIQLRANLDRTGSTIRDHRLYYSALASSVSPPRSSAPITNIEFDEEIERELARLPAKRAQEARRRLRNERRAEINGVSNTLMRFFLSSFRSLPRSKKNRSDSNWV